MCTRLALGTELVVLNLKTPDSGWYSEVSPLGLLSCNFGHSECEEYEGEMFTTPTEVEGGDANPGD